MAALITVVTLLISFLTPSMAVVAMSSPTRCTNRQLLLLSPCLPFISDPPNNMSDTVPSACCVAFSSVYDSGNQICLCYFLNDSKIFGFPLNLTKVIALSSFCPVSSGDNGMYLEKNSSLDSICADSQSLPPLQSSRIPRTQEPDSPADENTPAPNIGISPSATISPSAPAGEMPPSRSSTTAERFSLAKDCIGLFLSGSLFLISAFRPF